MYFDAWFQWHTIVKNENYQLSCQIDETKDLMN